MFTPARKSMPAIDYVSIVRSVYNDRRAMVVGALGCIACTWASGYVTGSVIFYYIALGFLASGTFRFIDMTRFKKANIGPADVDTAGEFEAEFELTTAGGTTVTFPNMGYLGVTILEDIA